MGAKLEPGVISDREDYPFRLRVRLFDPEFSLEDG